MQIWRARPDSVQRLCLVGKWRAPFILATAVHPDALGFRDAELVVLALDHLGRHDLERSGRRHGPEAEVAGIDGAFGEIGCRFVVGADLVQRHRDHPPSEIAEPIDLPPRRIVTSGATSLVEGLPLSPLLAIYPSEDFFW